MSIFVEFFSALGLFTSIFIGVVVLGLILEEAYDGYGFFAAILLISFLIGEYFMGGKAHNYVDLSFRGIGIYIGAGFLYALLRIFFLEVKTEFKNLPDYKNVDELEKWVEAKKKEIIQNNIWRWWINWPISALGWILGDVFKYIRSLIWKLLQSLFVAVFNLGNGFK